MISSLSIVLMKSVIYLPLIPKVTESPSTSTGIFVFPVPLSVLPEEIVAIQFSISICIKLLISLVKIPIFLIAFSQSDLLIVNFVLNIFGITSSLS
jgi:hypothetical protein